MAAHHLVVIGWLGIKRAYLDVPREEAIRRYAEAEDETPEQVLDGPNITEFGFGDEFGVYDAWPLTAEAAEEGGADARTA